MFVKKETVPVADGDNVIHIKAKMDFGTRQSVLGEAMRFEFEGGARRMDLGAYNKALLVHNIVKWEGPDFKGVPCTPENILALDPNEPLVKKVQQELAARNPVRSTEAQKKPKAAGSNASKES